MPHKKLAVVDGANIAFAEKSDGGDPKVANLVAVREALEEKGYEVIIIVDAALRHKVDEPHRLEEMIDEQTVRQAPAGTDADYFVIETAEQLDGLIISNDRYHDYREERWIEDRRIPLMIVDGQVELYEKEGEI